MDHMGITPRPAPIARKLERKAAPLRASSGGGAMMVICICSWMNCPIIPNHRPDAPPVMMLDLYSGPNAPLAKAFNWCGWRVVTPVDLERDAELDVSKPEVRQAIAGCLPQTCCIASAMSCATKSRAREKQPGPPPLRSVESPRGLTGLLRTTSLRTMPLLCNTGVTSVGWHACVRTH